MKTNDFQPALTSSQLQENIFRQFGTRIALEKYDRERLENVRNLLRTKVDQTEKIAGVNDLLTNETYQKDKAMLQLLNTRIKEMLGEDIKTLRDKLDAINEGKKSMKDPIRTTKAKGSKPDFLDLDKDGDRAEPMKSAAKSSKMKEAIKKDRKELEGNEFSGELAKAKAQHQDSFKVGGKEYPVKESGEEEITKDLRSRGGDQDTKSKFNKQETKPGVTRYTKKSGEFTSEPYKEKASTARTKADTAAKHADAAKSQDYDAGPRKVRKDGETHYYIGKKKCSKDEYDAAMTKIDKRADQAKRLAAMGEAAGEKTCNKSSKGRRCPVHGLQECGMVYESEDDTTYCVVNSDGRKVAGPFDTKKEADDACMRKSSGRNRGEYSVEKYDEDMMEGKDEGKPGKNFAKIAKDAGKRYGSKEAGERVAGAVRNKLKKQGKLEEAHQIFKRHVRIVNESLAYLLSENEEDKAKAITAAGDIVNDYTSWMQRVGQYQTKSMIELSDSIRGDFGVQQAEAFKNAVAPALSATLEVLTAQREAISNAVAVLAGEQIPETPMGTEPGMDMAAPDMMNEPADEFGAADAAAGAGTPGREMRESASQRRARKLAESHSIMSKLAR
jgi:hypothetical protein